MHYDDRQTAIVHFGIVKLIIFSIRLNNTILLSKHEFRCPTIRDLQISQARQCVEVVYEMTFHGPREGLLHVLNGIQWLKGM